jgi:tetratricopeptide (TPR) repeat protein
MDLKKYQEAINDYTQALEIEPNYLNALYGRGKAFKELKKYQEAVIDYTKVIEIDPNYNEAYVYRGVA